MPSDFDSRISIVVLTHNRIFELERTVYQLRLLPERPRIIVVDNGSYEAAAVRRIARFPEVTLVRSERNLGAAGRNLGVALVETPYVAFCDDDTWWESGALPHACDLLDAHPKVGLINARVLVGVQQKEDPACARMADSPLDGAGLPGPALISFMAGAVVMRTQAFRSVGGYEPQLFLGAEEALMSLDLAAQGWHMVYAPDVVVHHFPSPCRDRRARQKVLARNRLWIAALRLPLHDLKREVLAILREAGQAGHLVPVVLETLRGLPWAYQHRKVVPDAVCQMHRTVFAGARVRSLVPSATPSVTQTGV
ncbi:MAG: glycosyltransferase family 2 protein [Acidobacteriota bacterium]